VSLDSRTRAGERDCCGGYSQAWLQVTTAALRGRALLFHSAASWLRLGCVGCSALRCSA